MTFWVNLTYSQGRVLYAEESIKERGARFAKECYLKEKPDREVYNKCHKLYKEGMEEATDKDDPSKWKGFLNDYYKKGKKENLKVQKHIEFLRLLFGFQDALIFTQEKMHL